MSGLVIRAEDKLQRYEYKQKVRPQDSVLLDLSADCPLALQRIWNEERSKATTALAAMGSIGSEAEITR